MRYVYGIPCKYLSGSTFIINHTRLYFENNWLNSVSSISSKSPKENTKAQEFSSNTNDSFVDKDLSIKSTFLLLSN